MGADAWASIFRIAVGGFWLYFASQKWTGVGWLQPLIQKTPSVNPIPGLHEFLATVVAPNWLFFAVLQTVGETAAAVLLILGLFTRVGALVGLLLALNLALTVAFLNADVGMRWLYYLAVLVNAQVLFGGAGPLALDRRLKGPRWLRS